ncbi:MAG: trypsin-like peptidase domain-containing protein [Blastocatellia bacterium]
MKPHHSFAALLAGLFLVCFLVTPLRAQISVSGWTKPKAAQPETTIPLAKRAAQGEAPQIHRSAAYKINHLKQQRLPVPSAEARQQPDASKKFRVGVTQTLTPPLDVWAQSTALAVTDGEVRALRLASEGAVQQRLHFARVQLPDEARLFVYAANNPAEFYGPYRSGSDVWTPPITGSEAVVEIYLPAQASLAAAPRVELDQTIYIFRAPQAAAAQTEAAAGCNRDVPAEWAETAKSVALIEFREPDGEYVCSGVLLNDTKNSGTPYFLTANHCISKAETARGTRFYWNYDFGTPSSYNSNYGAQLLETSEVNDFTLLKLSSPVPTGVRFSGWTTEKPAPATAVTSIHHPDGDYKRISFGATQVSSCPSDIPAELCEYFHQVTWNSGITEPGSSGGGLWVGPASDPKLIGQLYGGESSCALPKAPDYYGRFDVAFEAIGGYLTGEGCPHSLSYKKQLVASAGTTAKVDVFANEIGACVWTARSTVDWIKVQTNQGQGDGAVSYTVDPNPSASKRFGILFIAGIPLRITQRGTSETCAPAQAIAFGQTVTGTLESTPCTASANPRSYSVRYTFDAQPGQLFAVSLKSSIFDAYLTLLGPNGEVVYENDDEYFPSTNARIPSIPYSQMIGVRRAGTYTIEVSSFDDSDTGAFTLTLDKGCTWQAKGNYVKYAADGVSQGAINTRWFEIEVTTDATCKVDSFVSAMLSNTTWLGTNFSPSYNYLSANLYNNQGTIRFELPYNNDARTRRGLIDIAGHQIPVEQAAFCRGVNQLQVTPATKTYSGLRQTGSVQIKQLAAPTCTWELDYNWPEWVTFPNAYEWGDRTNERVIQYQLQENKSANQRQATITFGNQSHTIVQESYDKVCPPLPLTIGQSVSGTIAGSDCPTTDAGFYVKRYNFRGYAGQQVAFTLTSPNEAMAFRVYAPSGLLIVDGTPFPPVPKTLRVPETSCGICRRMACMPLKSAPAMRWLPRRQPTVFSSRRWAARIVCFRLTGSLQR